MIDSLAPRHICHGVTCCTSPQPACLPACLIISTVTSIITGGRSKGSGVNRNAPALDKYPSRAVPPVSLSSSRLPFPPFPLITLLFHPFPFSIPNPFLPLLSLPSPYNGQRVWASAIDPVGFHPRAQVKGAVEAACHVIVARWFH